MSNNDLTTRRHAAEAAREIKASAHYTYVVNGITLDGTKFAAGELVKEGTCLVRDDVTKKYEKYAATMVGKSTPMILDESIKFVTNDLGVNPDVTAGQVLVHGAVYNGMLIGVDAAFKTAVGTAIRFVQG